MAKKESNGISYTHSVEVFESHGMRNLFGHSFTTEDISYAGFQLRRQIFLELDGVHIGFLEKGIGNSWAANEMVYEWLWGDDEPALTGAIRPAWARDMIWNMLFDKRIKKGPLEKSETNITLLEAHWFESMMSNKLYGDE